MKDVSDLRERAAIDVANNVNGVSKIPSTDNEDCKSMRESVVQYVKLLVSEDRKVTALKELQGHMWRHAYEAGRIKGHVYSDVPLAMASWFKKRIKMYIYSSGSVEAQKLLFGNSVAGDLLKYISGHFDTKTGNKREPSSYTRIAKEIGMLPSQILFLTDVVQEADAALRSGMQSALVMRPGNKEVGEEGKQRFRTLSILTDLDLFRMEVEGSRQEESVGLGCDNDFQDDILPIDRPLSPPSKKSTDDTICSTLHT
ncbi:PREDICTED: enolase-phosphatase E1-like isoform X2 [Amphimedon queenslandica]|nr:PREDICTED: enolase-phosphatase E1-like isoform X2 [Amphimedon queenslandica]|eukprot:XP_019849839.1 PREDICTED: enolase-phosphatase E1-like isoform X2 [Amphimedon queenslandica]